MSVMSVRRVANLLVIHMRNIEMCISPPTLLTHPLPLGSTTAGAASKPVANGGQTSQTAYIQKLNEELAREEAEQAVRKAAASHARSAAAQDRLTPLEDRLDPQSCAVVAFDHGNVADSVEDIELRAIHGGLLRCGVRCQHDPASRQGSARGGGLVSRPDGGRDFGAGVNDEAAGRLSGRRIEDAEASTTSSSRTTGGGENDISPHPTTSFRLKEYCRPWHSHGGCSPGRPWNDETLCRQLSG